MERTAPPVGFLRLHQGFLVDFAIVGSILLLQKFLFAKSTHLPVMGYLMPLLGWIAYAAWNSQYFWRIPKPIVLLAVAHFVGAGGALKSRDYADVLGPLTTGMFCLCVMGIFTRKYHRAPYPKLLALACFILTPLILWQSVTRNDIQIGLEEASRRGFSLLGWFSAIWVGYTMLIPRWNKVLWIIPAAALLATTSRTSIGCAFVMVGCLYFYQNGRFMLARIIAAVSVGALGLLVVHAMFGRTIQTVLVLQEGNIERIMQFDRMEEWYLWSHELSESPAIFGRGMLTYGNREEVEVYPHNGLLHVLNGYGLIAGAIYLWAFYAFARVLLRQQNWRTAVGRWSIGFFLAVCLHSVFECEVLGSDSVHIMSLFLAYAIAAGLWTGAPQERQTQRQARPDASGRNQRFPKKTIPAPAPG